MRINKILTSIPVEITRRVSVQVEKKGSLKLVIEKPALNNFEEKNWCERKS